MSVFTSSEISASVLAMLSVISAFSFYLVLTIVELSLKSGHLPPPEPFSYAILEKI